VFLIYSFFRWNFLSRFQSTYVGQFAAGIERLSQSNVETVGTIDASGAAYVSGWESILRGYFRGGFLWEGTKRLFNRHNSYVSSFTVCFS
jgi:hypothetical protein